ncbi:MAG: hypothetical protein II937_02450 [Bacteroidales bacterium]|nr:hypothetical protein [Bacteroidales bacterium]
MELKQPNEVVKDVTTVKKKYVKPDFEVINLEDVPRLLAGSATNNNLNPNFGSDTQDIW